MASTQAEAEVARNGPEIKEDGANTNGVDAQTDMDTGSTNGPAAGSNNGSLELNDAGSKGGYYKAPPPSGYDASSAGYDNPQSEFSYPAQRYGHHQPDMPSSYPYSHFPGSQNVIRSVTAPVATKPAAYMNSMPRTGGPVPNYPGGHPGQGYPTPSRYHTPTLNQLLQPGSAGLVQRYPAFGDYPRQQPPPTTQAAAAAAAAAGWPRNYNPAGFKPPANATQANITIIAFIDQSRLLHFTPNSFDRFRNVALVSALHCHCVTDCRVSTVNI